jgi:YNFM family putative membrane transporter
MLCGFCAFLCFYCTQPLLPLLTQVFHASKSAVGMTISSAALAVALVAPFFGAVTERLARKRVIVTSIAGVSLPMLLAAASGTLNQLIFWRFVQGLWTPGIVAVTVTYIGEEWPPERVALVMSFYVSGTVLGGFTGRFCSGLLAHWFSWRVSFLFLGVASLLGAAAVAFWLPKGRKRPPAAARAAGAPSFAHQVKELFCIPRLAATYAVGFNVLFSQVAVFTWITFYLAAPPFNLSTAALSYLFMVYLAGFFVTPLAGLIITKVGLRTGIGSAIVFSIVGVALTLVHSLGIVVLGLAVLACGTFIAQTATQSHLRVAAPAGARVTAAGLYLTCYYLGGTTAGVLPGLFWRWGQWPACVAFIVAMQICALAVALVGWRKPQPASPIDRVGGEALPQ